MHNDKSSDADDGAERNAAVGLVLAGLAERVAARLAPKTVADLREAVEKGHGDDVARWLTNVVVNKLDERLAHVTLPPDFQSEGACERCGGVVAFGIQYVTPRSSVQWEKLPEQCFATTTGGRCGWPGCGDPADDTEDEEIQF
jgi:hypothetical protein